MSEIRASGNQRTPAQQAHLKKLAASRVKHGLASHPLYQTWLRMKARCTNKGATAYRYYGGRGISICQEWINDAPAFYAWAMRAGWEPGLQIDRIDTNGNYEPGNCRWVTAAVNAQNRRRGKLTAALAAEIFLASGTVVEIGSQYGVSHSTVSRIKRREIWTNVTRTS